MSWIARLSWPGYLAVSSCFAVVTAAVAAVVWNAAGGPDVIAFAILVAVALLAGLEYGRAEIRTFFG